MSAELDIIAIGEPLVELLAEDGDLVSATRFRRGWGGDTSNLVIAASRLGGRCGYITRVGADPFGQAFVRLWREEGIDTNRVLLDPQGFTGIYFSVPKCNGFSFHYLRRGSAASRLGPQDLDAHYLARGRILHVSGITQAISPSAEEAVWVGLSVAHDHGVLVSYDANVRPQLRAGHAQLPVFERTVEQSHLVFLSDEEMAHLYPQYPASDVLDHLIRMGPLAVVLKKGRDGCLVRTGEGTTTLPAWKVDTHDPTGAGDAFAGAFLVQYLAGESPASAARFASAVGALTAAGKGAVTPLPQRGEVNRFMLRGRTA